MGVIEGTYITLTNYTKKKIEDLERGEKLLSCKIEGLEPMSHSNIAMSWTKKDPTILKEESSVKYTSTNSVAIYRIINNKLKISLDHVIFTKDGETDECSWNNVKSLRRGDLIFNESYEFEEITSLKKIKEGVSMVVLSLSGYPYYFANGYLIHNHSLCESCKLCSYWHHIITPYGPHTWNSSAACVGGHSGAAGYNSGLPMNQKQAYGQSGVTGGWWGDFPVIGNQNSNSASQTLPWNTYTGTLLYEEHNAGQYHYLYKDIAGWKITQNEQHAKDNVTRTLVPYDACWHNISNSSNATQELFCYYTGDAYVTDGTWIPWTASSTNTAMENPFTGVSSSNPSPDFKMYYKLHPDYLYQFRIYGGGIQREPVNGGWANIKERSL